MTQTALLQVRDVRVGFHQSGQILHGVSFEARAGSIIAFLGPNGAGKTTLLRAISGFRPEEGGRISAGDVLLEGRSIRALPPDQIARLGLRMIAERDNVFRSLSVSDNLRLVSSADTREASRRLAFVHDLFPPLKDLMARPAGLLSGGERQMLAIARALLAGPRVLLCDEISSGVAPVLVSRLMDALRIVSETEGVAIVIAEQEAALAASVSQEIHVMESGKIVASGPSSEMRERGRLRDLYLGSSQKAVEDAPSRETVDPEPVLRVSSLSVHFGGTRAVDDVSFAVPRGSIVGIIGPNGAGKTTVLNAISGFVRPTRGSIALEGVDISGRRGHEIAARGVARTFQRVQLLLEANALDNVLLGRHRHARVGIATAAMRLPSVRASEKRERRRASEILESLGVDPSQDDEVGRLPHATRRLIELARALATEPVLLLLDEPTAGMTEDDKEHFRQAMDRIRSEFGVTEIVIEHDVAFIVSISDHVVALDHGVLIAEGIGSDVVRHPLVVESYLGSEVAHERVMEATP